MKSSFDGLFCRKSLADTGIIGDEPISSWTGPDMIFHTPVDNHQAFFKTDASYDSDPNQRVQGDRDNTLYVRARKLGSGAEEGHFYAYATEASLVLLPEHWRDNPVNDASGREGSRLPRTGSGQVVVGEEPLLFRPSVSNTHYCLVGRIVTASKPNPIPTVVAWEGLIRWARESPNVCYRNLFLENNTGTSWSTLKRVANMENRPRKGLLTVETGPKVLAGTKVWVTCPRLGLDVSWTIERGDPGRVVRVDLLPRFDDFLEVRAVSPGPWSRGASVMVEFHLSTIPEDNLAEYAVPAATLIARGFEHVPDKQELIVQAGAITVVLR